MKLLIPPLSQRDVKWKDKKLGGGGSLGRYGCLVVCHSMALNYYGNKQTPDVLNELFKSKKAYDGNYLNFYAAGNVYADYTVEEMYHCYDVPADLTKIDKCLSERKPVIALVDFDNNPVDGVDSHFVLIIGKAEDGAYIINDPWTGEEYFFHAKYGEPSKGIYGLRIYSGIAPDDTSSEEKIAELRKELQTTNELLADKVLAYSTLQGEIEKQETKIDAMETELIEKRAECLEKTWKIEQLEVKVKSLGESIEKMDEQIVKEKNSHFEALTTCKEKNTRLKNDLAGLKSELVYGLGFFERLKLLFLKRR